MSQGAPSLLPKRLRRNSQPISWHISNLTLQHCPNDVRQTNTTSSSRTRAVAMVSKDKSTSLRRVTPATHHSAKGHSHPMVRRVIGATSDHNATPHLFIEISNPQSPTGPGPNQHREDDYIRGSDKKTSACGS